MLVSKRSVFFQNTVFLAIMQHRPKSKLGKGRLESNFRIQNETIYMQNNDRRLPLSLLFEELCICGSWRPAQDFIERIKFTFKWIHWVTHWIVWITFSESLVHWDSCPVRYWRAFCWTSFSREGCSCISRTYTLGESSESVLLTQQCTQIESKFDMQTALNAIKFRHYIGRFIFREHSLLEVFRQEIFSFFFAFFSTISGVFVNRRPWISNFPALPKNSKALLLFVSVCESLGLKFKLTIFKLEFLAKKNLDLNF